MSTVTPIPHIQPQPPLNETDKKWLDALEQAYSVIGSVLPFYRHPDGSVDASRTLQRYFQLIGLELEPDGRIKEK